MSFKASAAHSSRIKKPSKAPSFKRNSSGSSPYSSFQRRKPLQRTATKSEFIPEEDESFNDRLDDFGLVQALSVDLTLRDISQALIYIKGKMWTQMPERAGMNSTRIAEVLNFRASLPPVVTISHLQALLNSPTAVEKEIAELSRGGAIRKIVVGGRGSLSEALILSQDLDRLIAQSDLEQAVQQRFITLLHENPMAVKIFRRQVSDEDARLLMHRGFLTTSDNTWTTINVFSVPGEGSKGTMTSLNSISKAASGSLMAVGGQGAVIAAGGSGGGIKPSDVGDYSLALPATGPFLKLLSNARSHLLSLLSKSKYKEVPESLLRQRWDGGISIDNGANVARRNRGEFTGVLPGRTRKWKQFYGISFEWILGECVGAGLVEVFNSGSIGRGIRAL
ncbi:serine-threonine protein kinase 19-domain-containing protein [Tricladium varicosporioides]|nr:serine-threonine protein kinase 19-domain-containing protein [Hymenoscyphus varicosporioides]